MTHHTDADLLTRMPALAAYVQRIGAEQKNFRKYVVPALDEPTYGSIRRAKATITVGVDGAVTCDNPDPAYALEEAEAALIAAEVVACGLPTSMNPTTT